VANQSNGESYPQAAAAILTINRAEITENAPGGRKEEKTWNVPLESLARSFELGRQHALDLMQDRAANEFATTQLAFDSIYRFGGPLRAAGGGGCGRVGA
jgi:hypothetical protein